MTYISNPPFSTNLSQNDTSSVSTGRRRFPQAQIPGSSPLPLGSDPGCANVALPVSSSRGYVNAESSGGGHNPINLNHPDRSIVRRVEPKAPSPERLHRKPAPSPMSPDDFFYGNIPVSPGSSPSPPQNMQNHSQDRQSVISNSAQSQHRSPYSLSAQRPAGAPSSVLNGERPTNPPPMGSLPCTHNESDSTGSLSRIKRTSCLGDGLVPTIDTFEQFTPSRKLTASPFKSHIRDLPGFTTRHAIDENDEKDETEEDEENRILTPRSQMIRKGHQDVIDQMRLISHSQKREEILEEAWKSGAAGGLKSVSSRDSEMRTGRKPLDSHDSTSSKFEGAAGRPSNRAQHSCPFGTEEDSLPSRR